MAASTLFAGDFAAPAEGPVAFRRDKIPLDAETMADLSRQLVTLTQGLDAKTAVNRRTAAQMLALSTALDPGNTKAREVISGFLADQHPANADSEEIEKSRSRIWQDISWLETPEAGSQGQALAACLADILAISDSKNPRAQALLAAGERGAWKGWIPDLAAYEATATVEPAAPENPTPAETVPSKFLLQKAQVSTVIWKRVGKSDPVNWAQDSAPLQMVAEIREATENGPLPFSIVIGAPGGGNSFRELSVTLIHLLQKQYHNLPAGGRITISSPNLLPSAAPPKRQSISAAAAVLASAAISGCEPDAMILGVIDETGAFKLPTGFWSQLQSLGTGTGGRLILPAAAADYLPSMLALEKPQFFLEYEVLLASNFQELLRLSAKKPDEVVAKSIANFREIREKANLQAVGQYVANSFVRRRLVEITQEAPFHYSAKMLAIQGAGNRPTVIPRMILAAELRHAIEPMEWLVKRTELELEPAELERLGPTSELCRTQVDRLIRYAAKEDRALFERVQDMVIGVRTLDRVSKARGENYDVQTATLSSHAILLGAYQAVVEELAAATGDPEPVTAP